MPALDGLRGLAVAGVLLFHGGHLTGGYLGVDLFFVLSGFLITSLLLAESDASGSIGLGGFWARRARRLLPALGGVLVGVGIYCLVWADATELERIRGDALGTLAYVANWRAIFAGQDYWALFQSPSPLEHTWSLAIEEQFYLFWPLIFVGILALYRKATARAVFVVAVVLAALSVGLAWYLYDPADVSRVYYGTDTRAAALLVGVALAAWISGWGTVRSRAGRICLEVAGFAGVVFLAWAWIRVDGQSEFLYRGGLLLCGLSVVAIIAAAAHPEAGPLSRILSFRPLCLLGLISYGVYLWHWPVYIVLDEARTGIDGWPLFAVRVGVTLIIAVASFVLLEAPIRKGAFSPVAWRVLTPVAAGALVLVIFGTTMGAVPSSPASTVDAPAGSRNLVMVVGDSVAETVAPGLQHAGLNVVDSSVVGFRLVQGEIDFSRMRESLPWRAHLRRSVKWHKPTAVVVISGAWDLFDVVPPGYTETLVPGTPTWNHYYERSARRAVKILASRGAHVVFPTIPHFGQDGLLGRRTNTERSSFNPARVDAANRILRKLDAELDELSVPDLNTALSRKGKNAAELRQVGPLYRDGVHYTEPAADWVGKWLKGELAPWLTQPAPTDAAGPERSRTP
jgi:peptidoglycan/LPS O-acetylase OafA/YrhL